MPLPIVDVGFVDSSLPTSSATDTGQAIIAGPFVRGPIDKPAAIVSTGELEDVFGARDANSALAHYVLRTAFAEGLQRALIIRHVGPAAATATATFSDGSAPTMAVDAASPGDWANGAAGGLSVDIDAGVSAGTFIIKVFLNAVLVEASPELADKIAAVEWARASRWVRVRDLGGTTDPAATASPTNLAGGVADQASVTNTHRRAALDLIGSEYGPGQVMLPGVSTAHQTLLEHAAAMNRHALLDPANGSNVATIAALGTAARALGAVARSGSVWAQWARVPGPVTGSSVWVPWTAVQAGLIAARDAADGPHVAAAGRRGVATTVQELSASYNETDRKTLFDAGVNVARVWRGSVQAYGYRTPVAEASDPRWVQMAGAREAMRIRALAEELGEDYQFAGADTENAFHGRLVDMLAREHRRRALYPPDDPDRAFRVQTDSPVNTNATRAAGYLNAKLGVKTTPTAEAIDIDISRRLITEEV